MINSYIFVFSVDTQVMSLPELGDLRKVRVLHDNSGANPSWFLDKVIVLVFSQIVTNLVCSHCLFDVDKLSVAPYQFATVPLKLMIGTR